MLPSPNQPLVAVAYPSLAWGIGVSIIECKNWSNKTLEYQLHRRLAAELSDLRTRIDKHVELWEVFAKMEKAHDPQ